MSDTTLRLKLKKLPPAVMRLSVSTLTQKLIKFVNAHRHKILSTIISQLTLFNNFIIPSSMRGTVGHSTTAPLNTKLYLNLQISQNGKHQRADSGSSGPGSRPMGLQL